MHPQISEHEYGRGVCQAQVPHNTLNHVEDLIGCESIGLLFDVIPRCEACGVEAPCGKSVVSSDCVGLWSSQSKIVNFCRILHDIDFSLTFFECQ